MTPTHFIHEVLESNLQLFRLICTFNPAPQPEDIPAWFSKEVTAELLESPRARLRLLQLTYRKNAVNTPSFYDFRQARLRLALMDPPTLRTLTLWSGAAVYSPMLAKIIDKSTRTAVQSLLSPEGFSWAIKRAPLLATLTPDLSLGSQLPATQAIWQGGQACIQACLSGMPESFNQRVLSKLPSEVNWNLATRITPESREETWRFVGRILLKELAPQWKPCFE